LHKLLNFPILTPQHTPTPNFSELIGKEMEEVDDVISKRLSSDVPLVGEVAKYIISAGGKRIRPALLLLFSGALSYEEKNKYEMAAVVEFIHTATLLHDDVVDDSTLRRGRATANVSFGNPASVLVGDFLYSRAFQMMVDCDNMRIMQILANATNVIAEGEVQQLMNMHDASLTQEGYLEVIRSKTAKLFEASARIPAVLAGESAEIESACAEFGLALGTAFQVIDDVLDYDGESAVLGKNLGDDLREGKTTLPLIFAMQKGTLDEKTLIQNAIENNEEVELKPILNILQKTGAMQATREVAHQQALLAIKSIEPLSNSVYKEVLIQLASQLLLRST
jgi:octaprenyl-diphosphate synthase